MLLAQSQLRQVLAICLPCCIGWTFVTCLWLCSPHDGHGDFSRDHNQTQTGGIFGDKDHCAIEQAQVAIPGRQSTIDPSTDTVAQAFIKHPQHTGYENSVAPLHLPLSTADPPLERLCVYRI